LPGIFIFKKTLPFLELDVVPPDSTFYERYLPSKNGRPHFSSEIYTIDFGRRKKTAHLQNQCEANKYKKGERIFFNIGGKELVKKIRNVNFNLIDVKNI